MARYVYAPKSVSTNKRRVCIRYSTVRVYTRVECVPTCIFTSLQSVPVRRITVCIHTSQCVPTCIFAPIRVCLYVESHVPLQTPARTDAVHLKPPGPEGAQRKDADRGHDRQETADPSGLGFLGRGETQGRNWSCGRAATNRKVL